MENENQNNVIKIAKEIEETVKLIDSLKSGGEG